MDYLPWSGCTLLDTDGVWGYNVKNMVISSVYLLTHETEMKFCASQTLNACF